MATKLEYLPSKLGDVPYSWVDIEKAGRLLNYTHGIDITIGMKLLSQWIKNQYS